MNMDATLSPSETRRDAHRAATDRGATLPRRSERLWKLFAAYGRWYLRRHFHAVRLAGDPPVMPADAPVIVYLNHPAWWDPMVGILLAERFMPRRRHYGPIHRDALEKYRFFEKLGFFGIDPSRASGAATFLRMGQQITRHDDAAMWVTAQGRFTDARRRPVELQPGLAHLARRARRGVLLPLAIEYTFWTERLPEALVRWGEPVDIGAHQHLAVRQWQGLLTDRLTGAMDELAARSEARDPAVFGTLLDGSAGVGVFYDLWRRARARVTGRAFSAEHGSAS